MFLGKLCDKKVAAVTVSRLHTLSAEVKDSLRPVFILFRRHGLPVRRIYGSAAIFLTTWRRRSKDPATRLQPPTLSHNRSCGPRWFTRRWMVNRRHLWGGKD